MPINEGRYREIMTELGDKVRLVAVSKTKPVEDIRALYELGHRDFGENYVQELIDKVPQLPEDIRWHFIGHLQSNKVKLIAPFVHLIHGVDSLKLLKEIDRQGARHQRVIPCLLQVHIAREESKFGFDPEEIREAAMELGMGNAGIAGAAVEKKEGGMGRPGLPEKEDGLERPDLPAEGGAGSKDKVRTGDRLQNVDIRGLMGMASFTDDADKVRAEFRELRALFDQWFPRPGGTLSMGMSGDYRLAIAEGSNMVRIGSLLFGERKYT